MRGSLAEDRAADYLKKKGYKILSRNYRTRLGEIDIVALDGKELVFVEVKYGEDGRFRVDENKMRKIELAAESFMRRYGSYRSVRLDVLEVRKDGIIHLEGVEI